MPEINSLQDISGYEHNVVPVGTIQLGDPTLLRIERIRYVGDSWRTPFDLSYAHGRTITGDRVRIGGLPYQVMAGGPGVPRALYECATEAGVHLNSLCGGSLRDVLSLCW